MEAKPISYRLRCVGMCGKEVLSTDPESLFIPDVGRVCGDCVLPGAREAVEKAAKEQKSLLPYFR